MSNKNSIAMAGVVFMKYIQISEAGVHIYVAHSAKLYEETPTLALDLYNLEPEKLNFTESSNRADCDPEYTGHWIEVGKTTFLQDMPKMAPMWLQSGFPIFNKVFQKTITRREGKAKTPIYKVNSADLSMKEQAQLLKNFKEAYPAYLAKILKNYEANLKSGKYKTLAERIQKFKDKKNTPAGIKEIFGTVSGIPTKVPFTAIELNLARKAKVEKWLRLFEMDPQSFKSLTEMKRALKALL